MPDSVREGINPSPTLESLTLLEFNVIFIGEEHLSRGLPPPGGTGQIQGPPGHSRQCPLKGGRGRGQGQPAFQAGHGPRRDLSAPGTTLRFHSDFYLGIPYQLRKKHPDLKISVIAMGSAVDNLPMRERSRIADFFWVPDE